MGPNQMVINSKFVCSPKRHVPLPPTAIQSSQIDCPKNISAVKKGEAKKVQVTERPKDVISLWGQEKRLYQLGCIYRTPAYKVNSLK